MDLNLSPEEALALLRIVDSYADAFGDDPDSEHEVAAAHRVAEQLRKRLARWIDWHVTPVPDDEDSK